MPEQLTKHPDVTLEVLRSAGAQCGANVPQDILKTCPPERFCKLPGGEMCVYGLADAPRMTQITAQDWRALAQATVPAAPAAASVASAPVPATPGAALNPGVALASGVGIMLVGVAIGWKLRRSP